MRDLNVLKERIEYAERHLQASHTARERESEALLAMWSQIRERFEDQEKEIARYRGELADLTQANDELSSLVDRLIGTIEGSIETTSAETVPKIATLADDLLKSEPAAGSLPDLELTEEMSAPKSGEAETARTHDIPPTPDEPDDTELSFEEILGEEFSGEEPDDGDHESGTSTIAEDSASEGIRDLISRIEGAVAGSPKPAGDAASANDPATPDEDDALNRELEEIEALRSELNGLRNKISAGG